MPFWMPPSHSPEATSKKQYNKAEIAVVKTTLSLKESLLELEQKYEWLNHGTGK